MSGIRCGSKEEWKPSFTVHQENEDTIEVEVWMPFRDRGNFCIRSVVIVWTIEHGGDMGEDGCTPTDYSRWVPMFDEDADNVQLYFDSVFGKVDFTKKIGLRGGLESITELFAQGGTGPMDAVKVKSEE